MIKFPSINQFRSVIAGVNRIHNLVGLDGNGEAIYDLTKIKPTLKFRGTTKIHGTNAGIVYHPLTGEITFQSRERELTIDNDNAGFALYMSSKKEVLKELFNSTLISFGKNQKEDCRIVFYGEWCGGNIQKGVAITGLEKMFVIFAIRYIYGEDEDGEWLDVERVSVSSPGDKIYNVNEFGFHEIDINFNHPELSQNELIDLTNAVEKECPVGWSFGVSGVGEGIVWQCITEGYNSSDYWFKCKGEKHSVSKVKTLAPVDVEMINSINEFIENTVTESRLEQGLQNLIQEQQKPFELSSIGDFIRWVYNDIIKEETDTIVANQFEVKKLGRPVSDICRRWFISKYNLTMT